MFCGRIFSVSFPYNRLDLPTANHKRITKHTSSMDESPSLRWSSSFAVLPPSATSSRKLTGDKIILPQAALEQLLAAASAARSRHVGATFTSYDPFNPHASLNGNRAYHDDTQQLPNPLMFRLVNPTNKNVVYAGIREFSAPENTVELSPFLQECLGIDSKELTTTNGSSPDDPIDLSAEHEAFQSSLQISVEARQLPKGTYVRLRPLEAGYDPDDWKPLLERQLRESFTTLTRNSTLSVKGAQGETFRLLVDKFAPEGDGICVVDTDIEVDIEPLSEEQARETMRQIMSKAEPGSAGGSSKGGEVDIWKSVDGQVVPGTYVDYVLPSWNRSQRLNITLSGIKEEDSVDLFATPRSSRQRSLPRDSEHVFGDISPAAHGTKSITISPTNVELDDAESILISVHGYRHKDMTTADQQLPVAFSLRVQCTGNDDTKMDGVTSDLADQGEQEHSPDDVQCQNCFQWVPKRTLVLHENFCRRNNIVCGQCKSVFKKGSEEWNNHWHCEIDGAYGSSPSSRAKHDSIFHENRTCPSCEFTTNSLPDLARHRTSVCPGKLILCRFCHLEVPQEGDPVNPAPEVVLSGMTAHELADGARTTECHLCDKIIRLRDMETHLKHHELDKVGKSKPAICRNINCGRTVHGVGPKGQVGVGTAQGQGPGNALGLCSLCFGPLYVSMHDPEGKALRRRIERRYLGQLMTGCGKAHCSNVWCKTGRANTDLEPKGSSAAAALPLVKPLMAMVPNTEEPMYFCVDEASQTRRKVAEMMAAEGLYDLEWCVAAAEAEKASPERMRDWLQAWAPRKI
jgi:hypothetical protein